MRAAVYRGAGRLQVEDLPIPEPAEGEMLVKVDACGVCGTDIKKIQKDLLPPPRVFGHEIAGRVAAVGRGVTRFREGDRVALHHHIPCGSCFYCGQKAYAQCARYKENGTTAGFEAAGGGFSEYVKAADWIVARGAVPVPDGVHAEEASFVEPVNTCLKAVRAAGVERGQTVLVVGQGPIGLLLMQICRFTGADVITSDVMADRLAMSRALGAAEALDASAVDVVAEVRKATAGRGADVTLLATMGQAPLEQAIAAARPAARIMVFAATSPGETAEIDLGALAAAEKHILTSYSASVDVQEQAAELVFSRAVRVRELVTHRFPLEQAPEAVELASRPARGVLKVVLAATA